MVNAVFVVYSCWAGGGLKVLVICMNHKAAVMARSKVAGAKEKQPGERTRYYDLPRSNPYCSELHIVRVLADRIYPRGLEESKLEDFSGDLEKSEVIK